MSSIHSSRWRWCALAWATCLSVAVGCSGGSTSSSGSPNPGPTGVAQGGAADFGAFRGLLDDSSIPGPETLDAVGFLNEHKLQLPNPTCGQDVCVHAQVGISNNLMNGKRTGLLMLGMNTAMSAQAIARRPLSLGLAVDTSGSMTGEKIDHVRSGLQKLLSALQPEDRVTLVTFNSVTTLVAGEVPASDALLKHAVQALVAQGSTDIYAGLRFAFEQLELADDKRERRVLLVSDGEPTVGLTSRDRIVALGRGYAELGIGISTIGLGKDFDIELMRTLAERGAGSFYFVENAAAVDEVFGREAALTLAPLATQAEIDVDAGAGTTMRALFGADADSFSSKQVVLSLPILQVASRTSVSDNEQGRRGGGGAILIAFDPPRSGGPIANVDFSYQSARDRKVYSQQLKAAQPTLGSGKPGDYFSEPGVEKAFIALNVLAGLQRATEYSAVGEHGSALAILTPLDHAVARWLRTHDDADITSDLRYIQIFETLLTDAQAGAQPQSVPDPWERY